MTLKRKAIWALVATLALTGVMLRRPSPKKRSTEREKELARLDAIMNQVVQSLHRSHTTVTGRLSSMSNPNMQNIPKPKPYRPPESSVYEQLAAIEPED